MAALKRIAVLTLLGCFTLAASSSAQAAIIHVPGNQPTIQQGIDVANPGDEVVVAPGTYGGPLNMELDFGGRAITVRSSAGAEQTTIDPDGDGRGFIFQSGETADAVVDGFTIRSGEAFHPPNDLGGAIACTNGSSPTIRNCMLIENAVFNATGGGGAIACLEDAAPRFEDCLIANNWALDLGRGGGIACLSGAAPTFVRCVVTRNESPTGAGMWCGAATVTIEECEFVENAYLYGPSSGAGINCTDNSTISITNSTFRQNDACCGVLGGGINCQSSTLTVIGCDFLYNDGEGGGGLACTNSNVVVDGCTFVGNTSDNSGGGAIAIFSYSSPGTSTDIADCVFWNNRGWVGAAVLIMGNASLARCTLAGQTMPGGDPESTLHAGSPIGGDPGVVIVENTIIAHDDGAAVRCETASSVTMHCTDVYGNSGGNWIDCIAGQLGSNGNFELDPAFCHLPSGDLTLYDISPCAPALAPPGCGLIGALPVGCSTTSVRSTQSTSWGAVKATFR
jgi:hypothetical protein